MAEIGEDALRALIRLMPPALALRDELEESIALERYHGTGDTALKTYAGLHKRAVELQSDPYLQGLEITVPDGTSDKEKVSLVKLAAGQLLAYIEGQTGLAGTGSGGGNHHSNRTYNTAPRVSITLNNLKGMSSEALNKIVDMGQQAMKGKRPQDEEDDS